MPQAIVNAQPAGQSVVAAAVSTVIFSLSAKDEDVSDTKKASLGRRIDRLTLRIPLVRRVREPHLGSWALPGGWMQPEERLVDAAARTLAETTQLRPSYLEQLYTFGQPSRRRADNMRVISVIYSALVKNDEAATVTEDENVRWFSVDALPDFAFDHAEIVDYALWRLRNKVTYAHVAFYFLGDTFTLGQLRETYEAILQRKLDPANFRRRVESSGAIERTEKRVTGGRHRPPRLYRTHFVPDSRTVGPLT